MDESQNGAGEPQDGSQVHTERSFLMDQPPAKVEDHPEGGEATRPSDHPESDQAPKPSQAEGEDPDHPGKGEALEQEGHPSQAEGEDF
jgi:hypothetical protein